MFLISRIRNVEGKPLHLMRFHAPKATVLKTLLFQVPRSESTPANPDQGPIHQQRTTIRHKQRLTHHAANCRNARA